MSQLFAPDKDGSSVSAPLSPSERGRHESRTAGPLLASTSLLYAAFGMIYGVMQGGLPPVLRARGVDLTAIGWSFIILVPFGLTFLWAPLIDWFKPIRNAPKIGWIVPMQILIAMILLVVAEGETFPPAVLMALGLIIAFAAATMDVALDALSTSSVPPHRRAAAGGLKVASLAVGSIIGGGLFVVLAENLGWIITFRLCAGASVMATLPILLNWRWDSRVEGAGSAHPDLLAIFRDPDLRGKLARLTLASCVMVTLLFFNRIMLVDLGIPVPVIGLIVGMGAPLAGLVAAVAAVPILRRMGASNGILIFTAICLIACAAMGIGAWRGEPALAVAGAVIVTAGTNGFFAIICAATLGWAQGSQPATDYALLYGVSRLAATLVAIAVARLAAMIGWPLFYAGAACGLVVMGTLVRSAFTERRASSMQ
jgi:MFS transporter, PAT family, beta-lactamase induction signal transducer AmpG